MAEKMTKAQRFILTALNDCTAPGEKAAPAGMPGVGQIIEPDDYGEYLRKKKTHTRYGYMQWQRAKAANRRADQAEARASEAEARALAAEAALAEAEERCAKWADKVAAAIRAQE